ncbi:MAG: Protein of unknown function DUF55, partial [uncultured Acetobacteraceae bacterium]
GLLVGQERARRLLLGGPSPQRHRALDRRPQRPSGPAPAGDASWRPRVLLPLQHRQGDRGRRGGGARSLPGPDRPVRTLGLRGRARGGVDDATGDARRHQGGTGPGGHRPGAAIAPLGHAGLGGALGRAVPHGRLARGAGGEEGRM